MADDSADNRDREEDGAQAGATSDSDARKAKRKEDLLADKLEGVALKLQDWSNWLLGFLR